MTEEIEMGDFSRPDVDDRPTEETELDLPDIPPDIQESQGELLKINFVSDVRKSLNIWGTLNPSVYRGLSFDTQGQLLYNHKRITFKRGSKMKLYSVKTLQRSNDSREFLKLIGYVTEDLTSQREVETVAQEQTTVIKTKVESFKASEDWAKREKEKATRQLDQITDENERKNCNKP